MDNHPKTIVHSTGSSSLADVLERILDKGVVVAGDITVKIVDIELLTIQVRLLVCSVDKAREIGMSWWTSGSFVGAPQTGAITAHGNSAAALPTVPPTAISAAPSEMDELQQRVRKLEQLLAAPPAADNGQRG